VATVPGPWLLKPRAGVAAAGIQRHEHADDVWRALDRLGDDQSFHLLERLVPGELYHVESLVVDDRVVFAEVNQYREPPLEVYQGGGIYATRTVPRDRPEVATLQQVNERVLTGFGLGRGASHTEFMIARDDGRPYFIETSARVGRALTAELVEAATGVNLWGEWARLEAVPDAPYELPLTKPRHAGVVLAPARQERPDTSSFDDPEIVYRLEKKRHVGFVVAADDPGRVDQLLTDYADRIRRDYHPAPPAA
jgi:hypothetical protein